MDKRREELASKVILSDQVATELSLTDAESRALEAGMAIYEGILEKVEKANHGDLPEGAEDRAVEKAEKIVPGFGDALEKWANGFRKTFTSGKG